MAKKKDRMAQTARQTQPPRGFDAVSKRGWKTIFSGIGVVALGFVVLSFTDPAGQNWASSLSPFLLLGGYATIGVGIVLPEAPQKPSQTQNPVLK